MINHTAISDTYVVKYLQLLPVGMLTGPEFPGSWKFFPFPGKKIPEWECSGRCDSICTAHAHTQKRNQSSPSRLEVKHGRPSASGAFLCRSLILPAFRHTQYAGEAAVTVIQAQSTAAAAVFVTHSPPLRRLTLPSTRAATTRAVMRWNLTPVSKPVESGGVHLKLVSLHGVG